MLLKTHCEISKDGQHRSINIVTHPSYVFIHTLISISGKNIQDTGNSARFWVKGPEG